MENDNENYITTTDDNNRVTKTITIMKKVAFVMMMIGPTYTNDRSRIGNSLGFKSYFKSGFLTEAFVMVLQ